MGPIDVADAPDIGLAAAVRTTYRPRTPVDLHATLGPIGRGPYDPTTSWTAEGWWRVFRTPDGPATLHLASSAGSIDAISWGSGAAWAISSVPDLLGASDDWSALDVSAHPVLREALRRNPGLRLARTRRVFDACGPAIIEQKVPSLAAYRSWSWLVRRYGERPPGPAPSGMRISPTPEQWRRVPSWEWHKAGVDPRRSRTFLFAAQVAASLERTCDPELSSSEVAQRLRTVPGIGIWTAAETAQRSHGDPDAVSVGDYHLAHQVGEVLTGSRVDDDGMLELLLPWAGQRQRIVRLILASGQHHARRGPRMPIQDHRTH